MTPVKTPKRGGAHLGPLWLRLQVGARFWKSLISFCWGERKQSLEPLFSRSSPDLMGSSAHASRLMLHRVLIVRWPICMYCLQWASPRGFPPVTRRQSVATKRRNEARSSRSSPLFGAGEPRGHKPFIPKSDGFINPSFKKAPGGTP